MKLFPAFFTVALCCAKMCLAQSPSASLTPSATTYSPDGGTITFSVSLVYSGVINGLSLELTPPPGWAFGTTAGANRPEVAPRTGDTGDLGFTYISIPASPVTFSFTLTYPGGLTGSRTVTGVRASFRPAGGSRTDVSIPNIVFTSSSSGGGGGGGPSITAQSGDVSASAGTSVTLSVTASGTAPLSYQWRKDGSPLSGATNATLTVPGLTTNSGTYVVAVTNSGGTVLSNSIQVRISDASVAPTISQQPAAQVVRVGASAVFSVGATGAPAPAFQWRKNGTPIPGATAATFSLAAVSAIDAGGYDVIVSNAAGSSTSALAQLTVTSADVAPVITRQPESLSLTAGRSAEFAVVATGAPAPSYQWRKDGVAIAGATGSLLRIASISSSDAGSYSVVVSNAAGTVTSSTATLTVARAGFAGTYFGTLGAGGQVALRIENDNSVALLGFVPGTRTGYVGRAASVDAEGRFRITTAAMTSGTGIAADQVDAQTRPATAAATAEIVIEGVVGDGTISGAASSTPSLALTATRSASEPNTTAPGFYQAGTAGKSAQLFAIVSNAGRAFVLLENGGSFDGGTGNLDAIDTAGQQSVSLRVSPEISALVATVTDVGRVSSVYTGLAQGAAAQAQQRLVNISTRTTAGTGAQVAIVGFIIAGSEAKTVLVRAVGPTLRSFGVTDALGAPVLELRRDGALIGANTGWTTAADAGAITAAANRAGAFAFSPASADSALLLTLVPGHYTAAVAAGDGRVGVCLVEVYDLSDASLAQKLINISTRSIAGSGDNTLIAGLVVSGVVSKRVLIRGAGPALAQFGLTDVLSRPQLTLVGTATQVQNSGWSSSPDAGAIAEASVRVGAFPFPTGSADAAMLLNLVPGAYTVQLTGVAGAPGAALVEVYEVP